jgi:phosphoserine phosphatase
MKKLIFFDLDGTLSPTNSWNLFNKEFGLTEAEDNVLYDWHKRDLITFSWWSNMVTKIIRERNLCTKEKVEAFVKTIQPRPETVALIVTCKEKGYTPIILSGTMYQIAKDFASRIGVELVYTCSEGVFDENGAFLDITNADAEDEALTKLQIFKSVCEEHGVDATETIMVGDGSNDVEVFKHTTKGIHTGEHRKLREHAWKHVENISEVGELI